MFIARVIEQEKELDKKLRTKLESKKKRKQLRRKKIKGITFTSVRHPQNRDTKLALRDKHSIGR